MEYLMQFLATLTADPVQTRWIFLGTIGAAITLFGLGLLLLVSSLFDPMKRRLQSASGKETRASSGTQAITEALQPLSPYFLPRKDMERSRIQTRLTQAGYRSGSSLTTFYAVKLLLALAMGAIVLVAAPFIPFVTSTHVIYGTAIATFIGVVLPNFILARKIKSRKRQILHAFPDALDLLVACTEAGLGLNAALQRVANEIHVSYPALAHELALVNAEIRAGVDRVEALRGLSERTGVEEIHGLVSLLIQSLRFGTSIADSLRIYAEEFRDKRMQTAEEKAAKIGTKMIFPLVLCMFPSFFVVAIGPGLLGVLRALGAL